VEIFSKKFIGANKDNTAEMTFQKGDANTHGDGTPLRWGKYKMSRIGMT
jgi:hypothetical protein